jgi:hypothetical protein
MSNNLTTLLRKVFLGSLAGIVASNASSATTKLNILEPNESQNKFESIINRKPDLSPKLLLKKTSHNELTFMSHRSHRSHSSHRSHFSSYSGGGGTNSSTPSNNSRNSGISPNYDNSSGTSGSSKSSASLQLGSRTLRKGMSGTDVTELVNILLRKQYLKMDNGTVQVTGSYSFDETIEGAVKKFQSDNGLTVDGICGSTTIYYLKNK